jgi:hypothetical protein
MSGTALSFSWLQLIAALGFGSIVAALLGWLGAKAVAISNHRQNWINALRDDLVNYLKEVDSLHFRVAQLLRAGDTQDLEKQQDSRNAAMLAYRRVLMRLNMTETLHVNLADRLNELMTIDSSTADPRKIEAAVNASREVLKYEWAVTKYGILTRPILALKSWNRRRHPRD